jgi:hypothetical protein
MADSVLNPGNQEILCKYMVPLSSAMHSKQLAYLVTPGLCSVPEGIEFGEPGEGFQEVTLGPMALYQEGTEPDSGQKLLFKVTTSDQVSVVCRSDTVAIGYFYRFDKRVSEAAVYGEFSPLTLPELPSFRGVLVCLVRMDSQGHVLYANSSYAQLSNALLRQRGFLDDASLGMAWPGWGTGGEAMTGWGVSWPGWSGNWWSTVVLRRGNKQADYEECVWDTGAQLVKRRPVGYCEFGQGNPPGVYVLGCEAVKASVASGSVLPLVAGNGSNAWHSGAATSKAALENALQKVPFGVVVYGAVRWDGSVFTEFFNVRRTFTDLVKRIETLQSDFTRHVNSRSTAGNKNTAVFSHVALNASSLNGLEIDADGLVRMRLAAATAPGTVKVPSENGLSVGPDGTLAVALAKILSGTSYPGTVKVQAGNGLSLVGGTVSMAHASTSGHGAVRVAPGGGLAVDDAGVLSMELASEEDKGAVSVQAGNGLAVTNGVVSMKKASDVETGAVKVGVGNGLAVDDGVLSMKKASVSERGAVQVTAANGLSIADGLLSLAPAAPGVSGAMSGGDKSRLDSMQTGAQANPGPATPTAAGLMSATDKSRLDGLYGVPTPPASGRVLMSTGTGVGSYVWGSLPEASANLGLVQLDGNYDFSSGNLSVKTPSLPS